VTVTGRRRAPSDRYAVLLTQGTFFTSGLQLASASAVLPFICGQEGIYWAAGLLYPAYSFGTIVGNLSSPLIFDKTRHLRHRVLSGAAAVLGVLIVCNAIVAKHSLPIAVVFLLTSCAMGATAAVSKVALSDIVSSKLSEVRRGDLLLTQGAVGALVAIASTLLVVPLVAGRDPVAGHVDLLWMGAAGMGIAAVFAAFVGPIEGQQRHVARRARDVYRQGIAAARAQPWFRRYALAQLVFVPIGLGTTFYSLHAAEQHGDENGSLHVLVVSTSLGLLVGSALWRIVYRRHGARGMLLGSALLGSSAAVTCILAEASGAWSKPWVHGIVLLLATVANQAIFAAAVAWINMFASDAHRPTLLAFGALLVAVESIVVGAVLGALAEITSAIWPVTVVLVLNVIALRAAGLAPRREVGVGRG
jgi:MFS family permease